MNDVLLICFGIGLLGLLVGGLLTVLVTVPALLFKAGRKRANNTQNGVNTNKVYSSHSPTLRPLLPPVPSPLTMNDIDTMSGRTFEQLLQTLFEKQGYEVTLTPLFGDWGADLVLEKDGVKTLVQAKRWRQKVGIKAVQEVVAAKAKYQAENAMVVTNSQFYWQAKELARVNGVVLWNRRELSAQLSQFPITLPLNVLLQTEQAQAVNACCATCGRPVTETVLAYCRENRRRFDGQVFCYNHQPKTRFRETARTTA